MDHGNLRPVRIRRLGDEEVRFPEVVGHGHGVHEGGAQGLLAAGGGEWKPLFHWVVNL